MSDNRNIKCVIIGGGGHARVLIDTMHLTGRSDGIGILDEDPLLWGKEIMGLPILGGDKLLPQLARQGASQFIVGVGSIRDNRPRRKLFEMGIKHGLKPITVIHPGAVCSKHASVGAGSVIFPGAVVNAGAVLGTNVIVNSGSVVEHDCDIGDHVHIASGSVLCSTVTIGTSAHIGSGTTIRQGISIGAEAVVGAGSVVVKDVESSTIVFGVPARAQNARYNN